jgi:GntR family transcriptional regulator, sialic acid-inducible nan operon repressor
MNTISIDRRKLFQQVASHLERQILDGSLKPGDLLPTERDLQTAFGVGRPAIREALIALQRAGLVETANGLRARVAMPTASGVVAGMGSAVRQMLSTREGQLHFQAIRHFFETGLARLAARNATPEEIAALKDALDQNAAARGDRERFILTDIAFHLAIAKIPRNPIFLVLHDAMSDWLRSQRVVTLAEPDQEEIAFNAHVAIYEAIATRNADKAERAMAEHLDQLSRAYWAHRESSRDGGSAAIA